jgi:hypothetical protein
MLITLVSHTYLELIHDGNDFIFQVLVGDILATQINLITNQNTRNLETKAVHSS